MERPKIERSFDKNRNSWIGLTGIIPPWTFQRCYKIPSSKNPNTNTKITFEGLTSSQKTYKASQVFVEHTPNDIYTDQVVPGEFHYEDCWDVLKINPRAICVQDEVPDLRFYLEFDRKHFPDVSILPFSQKGDNFIVEASYLKEKNYKGITVRNRGPLQYFPVDSVDFIIKNPRNGILVVFWHKDDDPKMSTYSLRHI